MLEAPDVGVLLTTSVLSGTVDWDRWRDCTVAFSIWPSRWRVYAGVSNLAMLSCVVHFASQSEVRQYAGHVLESALCVVLWSDFRRVYVNKALCCNILTGDLGHWKDTARCCGARSLQQVLRNSVSFQPATNAACPPRPSMASSENLRVQTETSPT